MRSKTLKVVEIFRSIQGEGANAGRQATFIRLAGCNMKCWFCDTDWSKGVDMTAQEVLDVVTALHCKFIVWTGGEPTLQLTDSIVQMFAENGFCQAIETNGSNIVPKGINYISCSPKVRLSRLKTVFAGVLVDEFRYPYGISEKEPPNIDSLPAARNYFLSPVFLGNPNQRFEYSPKNVQACLELINKDPRWRLSLQTHKLINVR